MSMKTLAKTLAVLTLIAAVTLTWLIWGAHLRLTVISEDIIAASDHPEEFEKAVARLGSGELDAVCWRKPASLEIEDYSFIVITAEARSYGILPCEWITAGVSPLEGDYVLLNDRFDDIRALGSSKADIVILADSSLAAKGHKVWAEYYAFGIKTYSEAK